MWVYQKTLQHHVNIKNNDLKMANYLIKMDLVYILLMQMEFLLQQLI